MRMADRGLMWHGMFLFLIGLVTGLQRAALHKYAHGAFRASGGRDERHLPDRAGCDLGPC